MVLAGHEDLAERVEREIAKSMADAGMPDVLGIEARFLVRARISGFWSPRRACARAHFILQDIFS
jgi:hypothetical protein